MPADALVTAIDALPRALAVFDREDRLVCANRAYRALHAAVADRLVPGARFEDLLRCEIAASAGDARPADVEAQVQARLAQRSAASGPFEVRSPDGRALRIEQTRTDDGGTCVLIEESAAGAPRDGEAAYRAMIEGSVQGVLINRDHVPLFANQACSDILGYATPQEVIALGSTERIYAPHEHERMHGFRQVRMLGGDAPTHYEVDALRKDGTTITLHIVVHVTTWDGAPAIHHGMIDVTRQHRDRLMRERELDLLHKVVSHAPVILWSIDRDGGIELSEGRGLEAQGVRSGSLVGRSIFDVYRDYPDFLENVRRALAGEAFAAENETAGAIYERWLEPVRDSDGEVTGVIGVSVDVTRRKRAEAELLRYRDRLEERVAERTEALGSAERRLRRVLETSPIGIAIVARSPRRRLFVNRSLLDMFGARDIEHLDSVPMQQTYVDAGELERIGEEFEAAGGVRGREVERVRMDGTRWWVQMDAIEAEFAGERAAIVWHYDVTDRREAVEALRAAKEEAERQARLTEAARRDLQVANEELQAFSYSVSHDLRQPLRAIDGFSQAILDDCGDGLDETGRDYLLRVRRASQRMGELIDGLLLLSRLTRTELRRERVRLDLLAMEVVGELRTSSPQHQVEVRIQPAMSASGDPRLLRIVLSNLLGNAWKFTARTAHPVVEMAEPEPGWFVVRDNGVGFDMSYVGKLFEPFQRLHGADAFEGLGIGLATVRRIIQRHGGSVRAEARVGGGAQFYFTLGTP